MKAIKATALVLALVGWTSAAKASVYAFTSFEEPSVGNQYTDTGDPLVDHALVNNAGEADVNYVAGTNAPGLELGFSAYYTNTRDDVGITDGDFIGIQDYTGVVGAYTDGDQGYELSDCDGLVTVTLDSVAVMGANPTVSLDLFVQDTGYETDDRIRVWVETSGGDIDLFNLSGDDLELVTHDWVTLSTALPAGSAVVKFEMDSNSGSEAMYVDNIQFDTVPEPATLALLGLGGIALFRRRR